MFKIQNKSNMTLILNAIVDLWDLWGQANFNPVSTGLPVF
jgi:hypothetical protein